MMMMMISEYHKRQGLLHYLSDYQFLEQGLCSVKEATQGSARTNVLRWAVTPPTTTVCFLILPSGCLIVLFTKTVVIIIFPSVMSFAVADVGQTQLEGNATAGTERKALSATISTTHRTSFRGLSIAGYLNTGNTCLYMTHNIATCVKLRVRFPAGERDFFFPRHQHRL
jgi:hypothetical protein